MVIDFVFDKKIIPWDTINLTVGETSKIVELNAVSKNIRRLTIPNSSETLLFEKKNIWLNGIEEIVFSIDGIFFNVFHSDRLPCAIYMTLENDSNYKSIEILNEATIITDLKSQKRWKAAVFFQTTMITILMLFLSTFFSLILKNLWFLSSIIGCLCIFSVIIFVIKKERYVLKKIDKTNQQK